MWVIWRHSVRRITYCPVLPQITVSKYIPSRFRLPPQLQKLATVGPHVRRSTDSKYNAVQTCSFPRLAMSFGFGVRRFIYHNGATKQVQIFPHLLAPRRIVRGTHCISTVRRTVGPARVAAHEKHNHIGTRTQATKSNKVSQARGHRIMLQLARPSWGPRFSVLAMRHCSAVLRGCSDPARAQTRAGTSTRNKCGSLSSEFSPQTVSTRRRPVQSRMCIDNWAILLLWRHTHSKSNSKHEILYRDLARYKS